MYKSSRINFVDLSRIIDSGKNKKTLLLVGVCNSNVCEDIAKFLSKRKHENLVAVSIDDRNDDFFSSARVDIRSISEFVDKTIVYKDVSSDSFDLAKTWYMMRGKDITEYRGISYGSLVIWEMCYFLSALLKSRIEAEKIFEQTAPERIIFISEKSPQIEGLLLGDREDFHVRFFRRFAKSKGIEYYEYLFPVKKPSLFSKCISLIKKLFMRSARFFLATIMSVLKPFIKMSLKNGSILVYVRQYLGETLLKRLAFNGRRNVFILNRKFDAFLGRNLFAVTLDGFYGPSKDLNEVYSEFRTRLDRIAEYFDSNSILPKSIIWEDISDRITYLFAEHFPLLFRSMTALEKLYRNYNVSLVVVPFDTVEMGKMIVLAASKSGIKSLVVLHGMVGEEKVSVGFVPFSADKIAVWGDDSASKLAGMGVPENKIFKTGCPRFDVHASTKMNAVPPRSKQVLVVGIPSLYCRKIHFPNLYLNFDELKNYYKMSFDAARKFTDIQFVIKCKDRNDYLFVSGLLRKENLSNVEVVYRKDVNHLISSSSIVVTHGSTIALEALIMNVPLIFVRFRKLEQEVFFDRDGVAIPAFSAEDLTSSIGSILNGPQVNIDLSTARESYLQKSFVKLDGNASNRVAELSDQMIFANKVVT